MQGPLIGTLDRFPARPAPTASARRGQGCRAGTRNGAPGMPPGGITVRGSRFQAHHAIPISPLPETLPTRFQE